MDKKIAKDVLDIKRKLLEYNIDHEHLAYMPVIPLCENIEYSFVVETYFGIKVIRLITAPNN